MRKLGQGDSGSPPDRLAGLIFFQFRKRMQRLDLARGGKKASSIETALWSDTPSIRISPDGLSYTTPAPLSRSSQQITKDEVVGQYLSQKSWFTTGH
ncbi:hypothetical protein SKAU_G00058250 [Synaphobranchus kaupii]|uniref:Uncharacterized protein n=1 Tax=Synaphobranchus kaupii TaxID=118154 RepID=A0A9Q1G5T2_SYNKA|nr:hypothetical protein SKAU_G00058250 [Synaphobranchus kaupii]